MKQIILKLIQSFRLLSISIIMLVLSPNLFAKESFVQILKSITNNQAHVVEVIPAATSYLNVSQLAEAQKITSQQLIPSLYSKQNLEIELAQATFAKVNSLEKVKNLMRKKMMTIVIVPGLFAEFIDTRAFEEIFSRESSFKKTWLQLSQAIQEKDLRFNLKNYVYEVDSMTNLIDAASIDDENGQPLVKMIILKTPFGSLESIGNNVEKAEIFNRRLVKYIEATQDDNLILLGYSRGTPLALEMITQAEKQKLPYLKNVQAVLSYAGVVTGSSLADLTEDASTESGRIFNGVRDLQNSLVMSSSLLDRPFKATLNTLAINKFFITLGINTDLDIQNILKNTMSGDFKTAAHLIARAAAQLGLTSLITTDFNGRVQRLKTFIDEILKSIDGLKTKNSVVWWQTHRLPKNIKYLSIAAGMVDPDKSEVEKLIYNLKTGYNDTLDDDSLQANRRTYEKATGVALNDSQVALHQTLFLPKMIEGFNSENNQLAIEHLGLMQTHHWGVSLRTVNVMKDGRVNPFPREKVIMSLVAYLNQTN